MQQVRWPLCAKRALTLLVWYTQVPTVHWPLSSKRVLTMEYVSSARVNDVEELTAMGLRSKDVACALSSVFAEMTLCHG